MKLHNYFPNQPIDAEIEPLVSAMNASATLKTMGSCCGHGKDHAYIDFAVKGKKGLANLTKILNCVDTALAGQILIDVSLNWHDASATACDFQRHPSFIMLSMTIDDFRGPVSAAALLVVAKAWQEARQRFEAND